MADYSSLTPQEIEALMNGPGLAPPAGVIPNFKLSTRQNGSILALYVVCMILAGTAAFLRVYSRVVVSKKVHVEDCK